jgi:anti-sigma regulatory factor (Ser/Thr protein kinase)
VHIAVYTNTRSAPDVTTLADLPRSEVEVREFIETVAGEAHRLAAAQGGHMPPLVFDELVSNLAHADFKGVVITILDGGNTLRLSDAGPGIPSKDAALRPGFTTADGQWRQFIRGVGSGFAVVEDTLTALGGTLELEDNLGQGAVVTARIPPLDYTTLASPAVPSYNLSERRLKALLLAVELAPVGPTRLAQELGVSTSTAYRDLVSLEEAGLVASLESGHRAVTDAGLAHLNALLS